MPDSDPLTNPHPASWPTEKLLSGCDTQRTRRGGPGGQHRNKTETAIVVTHRESGVSGQASERRSQLDNREAAVFRLRLNLAISLRCDKPVQDEAALPSEMWRSRAVGGKLVVSPKHADFPALVAEALDWVFAYQFDLSSAAKQRLGLSTSQLVKFLKLCPEAWQLVQQNRVDAGLPRLK
ncbi:peptide chain release factor family protein [Mariniblastus fucicola]|nr:peptide chain release factor-like protein [Mariniblastus fucicola]